jgi:hypothetical protein
MFNCLMNEEKLLCLKNRGRIVSENSFCFLTMNESPSGVHPTIESYFKSYNILLYMLVLHRQSHRFLTEKTAHDI